MWLVSCRFCGGVADFVQMLYCGWFWLNFVLLWLILCRCCLVVGGFMFVLGWFCVVVVGFMLVLWWYG